MVSPKNIIAILTLVIVTIKSSCSLASDVIPSLYHEIANKYNVPVERFYCVALQESGKKTYNLMLPWPWTINVKGRGFYYKTKIEALKSLNKAMKETNLIDVGIMQINVLYHKKRFTNIEQMLDPRVNLSVGAEILKENFDKFKDWNVATGKYHSYGKKKKQLKRARKYVRMVRERCKKKNLKI